MMNKESVIKSVNLVTVTNLENVISRPAAASTATGNKKQHEHEVICILSMFVGSPYKPTTDNPPKSGNGGKGGKTTEKKVSGGGEPATPVDADTGGTPAPPLDAGDPTLKASPATPPTSAIPSSAGGSAAAGSAPNSVGSIPPMSTTPVATNPSSVQAPPVSIHSSPSSHHDMASDINISPEVLLTDMKKNSGKKPTTIRPDKKMKKSFYINYEMIYEKNPKKKS